MGKDFCSSQKGRAHFTIHDGHLDQTGHTLALSSSSCLRHFWFAKKQLLCADPWLPMCVQVCGVGKRLSVGGWGGGGVVSVQRLINHLVLSKASVCPLPSISPSLLGSNRPSIKSRIHLNFQPQPKSQQRFNLSATNRSPGVEFGAKTGHDHTQKHRQC